MMSKKTTSIVLLLCLPFLGFSTEDQSYDVTEDKDTINRVDEKGRKQGYWVIDGSMKNIPGYGPDQVIEEGRYKDSRKTGLWKKYYPNGNLKSKITYERSRPKGPYTLYYKNGKVEEKGKWKYNKNVGDFKRYHKNGELAQDFQFNEQGKSEGVQKYYHENGQLELKIKKKNGKEDGVMKRYYKNGELKEKKVFNDGDVKPGSIKKYDKKSGGSEEDDVQEVDNRDANITKGEKSKDPNKKGEKITEGYHTLYNDDNQVTKAGYFKNGKLWKGKWRKYNEDGVLVKIEIYREGKYIGDGVLPDDK